LTFWANYQAGQEVRGVVLYRRIPNDPAHWIVEELRPTSNNFKTSKTQPHLSTQLAEDAATVLAENPGLGLLEVESDVFWRFGLRVTYEPEQRIDHVAVWGLNGAKRELLRQIAECILRAWEPGSQRLVYPA
jgi:hypothetical protein